MEGVTKMRCEVGKPLKAVSVVAASVEGMKLPAAPSLHPTQGEGKWGGVISHTNA